MTHLIITSPAYPKGIQCVICSTASFSPAPSPKESSSESSSAHAAPAQASFSSSTATPDPLTYSDLWSDEASRYEYRSKCGKYFWHGDDWYEQFGTSTSIGCYATLSACQSRPPTEPPPGWKPEPAQPETFTWEQVKGRRGVWARDVDRIDAFSSDGLGTVLYSHGSFDEPAIERIWKRERYVFVSPEIPAHVAAKFPNPTPAPVAADGTVDAEYVASHAGEYEFVRQADGDPAHVGTTYSSDGEGKLHFKFTEWGPWIDAGKNYRFAQATRFRPISTNPATAPTPGPRVLPPKPEEDEVGAKGEGEPVLSAKTWTTSEVAYASANEPDPYWYNRARADAETKSLHVQIETLRAQLATVTAERDTVMADYQDAASKMAKALAERDAARAQINDHAKHCWEKNWREGLWVVDHPPEGPRAVRVGEIGDLASLRSRLEKAEHVLDHAHDCRWLKECPGCRDRLDKYRSLPTAKSALPSSGTEGASK